MAHRANVALLVSHLDNEFSSAIIAGANRAAQELDCNLVIFPARFIKADREDVYGFQHNTLIRYANCRDFDLVIVEAGTIGTFVTDQEMNDILSDFVHTKVLTLAKKVGDFPYMKFNTKGFREEIEHLFKKHKYKNVGYVGGPLTNDDAKERLEVYKEVLEEMGVPYNPYWVCEGDFSEFSLPVIREFMTAQAENLDAIVFANDRMAILGYQVAQEMGLQVGKDIAFAAFDDIPDAMVCDPPLTTVHADSEALGYQAVRDGLMLVEGYKTQATSVDTVFMERTSCGFLEPEAERKKSIVDCKDSDEFINLIFRRLFANHVDKMDNQLIYSDFLSYIRYLVELVYEPDDYKFDREAMKDRFHKLLLDGLLDAMSIDDLNQLVEYASIWVKQYCGNPIRYNQIQRLLFSHCKQIVIFNFQSSYVSDFRMRNSMRSMNHLINGLFLNGFEFLDEAIEYVEKDLDRINVGDVFIYLHEEDIVLNNFDDFRLPHTHKLRMGRNEDGIIILEPENRSINSAFLFSNKFMSEKRKTLLVGSLFMAEEHFGIIVAEMKPEDFYFFNLSVRPQFSFLVKLASMQAKQRAMMAILEQNLGDARGENIRLNQMSKEDSLTGENNHRGFKDAFDEANKAEENQGKQAVMIFCDLNNLKQINDSYGHEEGNYAICKISEALRATLPENAVVARIGGDELTAFAIMEAGKELEFRDGMKRFLTRENMLNGKKYWIESSIGYYEFLLDKNNDSGDVMNEADILMYADKKVKRKKVHKSEK